jgi:hypothetical protein
MCASRGRSGLPDLDALDLVARLAVVPRAALATTVDDIRAADDPADDAMLTIEVRRRATG